MRGQVIAVSFVIASAVALLIMSLSALSSLRATAEAYYERYRFADVFAGVERAPEKLKHQILDIPGVQTVQTRVSAFTTIDIDGMDEPVMGRLISLPTGQPSLLNMIALRSGRYVAPRRDDEAVVLAPFAEAHGLVLGDTFTLLLNGTKRDVHITGIALSPEFAYAIGPGAMMPDDKRFGVVWMDRTALEAAYDLDGAFNDVSLALLRGTDPGLVIDRLDTLLRPYGGTGAVARADQISNWFLMNELDQLRTQATILPTIFLIAAAFLTNTFLARLIDVERREISLMKAFGYSNLQVGIHYSLMAAVISVIGIVVGWALGARLGLYQTGVYTEFFDFPFLQFRPSSFEFLLSAAVSLAAALSGAIWAVRRAVILPPAAAMQPPTPERYKDTALTAAILGTLDHATRMILRHIARTPMRSLMTMGGVSLSVATLIIALQWYEIVDRLAQSHFAESQRQHITIGFFDSKPMKAKYALAQLPGVLAVEPLRMPPADFSKGRLVHRGSVTGLPLDADLQIINDVRGWGLPVPRSGIVVGTAFAEKLDASIGDIITLEFLEGAQPTVHLPITGLNETYMALPVYMDLDQLNRILDDPPVFQHANLLIDKHRANALYSSLKSLPGLSSVSVKDGAIETLYDTLGETILIFISFFVFFASILAIGVVYNATRIALSERGRELATLRVLGFGKTEVGYILFGEATVLTIAALPFGCLLGAGLSWLMMEAFETELFRVPYVFHPPAYASAVLIVLAATLVSGILVRRQLNKLDLISVLKTRE